MALSFPSSPTLNQTYTLGTKTWTWNGTTWKASSSIAVYDTATTSTGYLALPSGNTTQRPGTPVTGATRINSETSYLETYYNSSWLTIARIGLGSSAATAASSAAQLRVNGITTDGAYWFSTSLSSTPFQAYVKFNYIDGGDWYLLLKVYNQGDMTSGSAYWTNTTVYNAAEFNLPSGTWSKYQTWNAFGFTKVMTQMTQGGTTKIPPIMTWNTTQASFAAAITSAGTPGNQTGLRCDSTDPAIITNATLATVSMKYGTAFTSTPSLESYMQHYGIGCWGNTGINSTTAEGYTSLGRAGAWIGCVMDDTVGHTFNAYSGAGADSGFGIGCGGGNPAKTTSAGWDDWTAAASVNTLPAYVWIR